MRKLIILAVAAPTALFAGGAFAQTAAPMPESGASSSAAPMESPATPPAASSGQPDASGGQLTGAPSAEPTTQGANASQQPDGVSQTPARSAQQPSNAQPGTDATKQAQDAQRKPGTGDGMPKQNAEGTTPKANAGQADAGAKAANKSADSTAGGSATITAESRTTIKQTITRTEVAPFRDVNFSVNIGVAVPQTVEMHPLPPRVVEIVPQYRSYRYFVLADGRIVIVRPDTYKIVYVIT